MKKAHFALTSLLVAAAPTLWSALIMTDVVFSAQVDNQSGLVSFEANNSGTTLQPEAIATTTLNGESLASAFGWHLGTDSTTGVPSDDQDAINDAYVTTNLFGLVNGATFSLNTTVNDGDAKSFFLIEHLGNDDGITLTPTSGGTAISTWSLTLNGSDYAAITTTAIYDWENQGNPLAGTVFTLADFTGGTGTLTGVDGLIVNGDGRLDPAMIGVATPVPEPATFAALAGVLALGLVMLRRRRS